MNNTLNLFKLKIKKIFFLSKKKYLFIYLFPLLLLNSCSSQKSNKSYEIISNNYVFKIFYVLFFILIYIGNQHFVEKKIREINTMEKEVEELWSFFITIKNNYMFSKKESEVLKRVKKLGLESSKVPPEKIILNKWI